MLRLGLANGDEKLDFHVNWVIIWNFPVHTVTCACGNACVTKIVSECIHEPSEWLTSRPKRGQSAVQSGNRLATWKCGGLSYTQLKSRVGLLPTAHYWANAGVLLGARVRRRVAFEIINYPDEVSERRKVIVN